jgi:hypothetical protein
VRGAWGCLFRMRLVGGKGKVWEGEIDGWVTCRLVVVVEGRGLRVGGRGRVAMYVRIIFCAPFRTWGVCSRKGHCRLHG